MPSPVHHSVVPLPPAVDEAHELVAPKMRSAIIHWLTLHPRSLVSEIVSGVGSQRKRVWDQLQALVAIGVVVPDQPVEQRRWIRYSVDTAKVSSLLGELNAYLQPDTNNSCQ